MKKTFSFLLLAFTVVACNNAPIEPDANAAREKAADSLAVAMPYRVATEPDWERGRKENVTIAMNTLKAYETNDMNALQQLLADSVEFNADGVSFKGSRDSLVQLMKTHRDEYNSIAVNMLDYESVKSKKRGEEWVGLWYIETQTSKNNQTDSMYVMDDIKIVNGKVAEIDSKARRFPAKN